MLVLLLEEANLILIMILQPIEFDVFRVELLFNVLVSNPPRFNLKLVFLDSFVKSLVFKSQVVIEVRVHMGRLIMGNIFVLPLTEMYSPSLDHRPADNLFNCRCGIGRPQLGDLLVD